MVRKIIMLLAVITLLQSCDPNNRVNVQHIKRNFWGVVISKVELRKNLLTHARIKLDRGKDTLVFIGENLIKLNIGDSIYKPPVSPFFFYQRNGKWNKEVFVIISDDLQKDKVFPEQWRVKCQKDWADACK